MIKINLATRKQGAGLGQPGGGGTRLDLSILKEPPVRRALLLAFAAYFASYTVDYLKEEDVKKLDQKIAKLTQKKQKQESQMEGLRAFDERRKTLEQDEVVIKRKLDVMRQLMEARTVPSKMLVALTKAIPKDCWLTDLSIKDAEITIKGRALEFSPASDFMKTLSESAYFTHVTMKESQQIKDRDGTEVTEFELSARQREIAGATEAGGATGG